MNEAVYVGLQVASMHASGCNRSLTDSAWACKGSMRSSGSIWQNMLRWSRNKDNMYVMQFKCRYMLCNQQQEVKQREAILLGNERKQCKWKKDVTYVVRAEFGSQILECQESSIGPISFKLDMLWYHVGKHIVLDG